MENADIRKREYYQALRVAILEIHDLLPKRFRDLNNETPVDILLLTDMLVQGADEDYVFRYAQHLAEAGKEAERAFIAGQLKPTVLG